MSLALGLLFSGLLFLCLVLESSGSVRWLYSIVLLLGIFAFGYILLSKSILLTPLCLVGIFVNLIFFTVIMPIFLGGDKKNGK